MTDIANSLPRAESRTETNQRVAFQAQEMAKEIAEKLTQAEARLAKAVKTLKWYADKKNVRDFVHGHFSQVPAMEPEWEPDEGYRAFKTLADLKGET